MLGERSVAGSAGRGRAASPYGSLQPADANGLALPAGFTSRVVATTGEPVPGTQHVWHGAPDGGATFPVDGGGWAYVSNSELGGGRGGAGTIVFGPDGTIVGAGSILSGTSTNCAGGPTPWGTWLSCEETPTGRVWECDPLARRPAEVRPAMGRLWHEAAAVEPARSIVYLTEDQPDGCFYRFVPTRPGDLSAGQLQVLVRVGTADDGHHDWRPVPDPSAASTACRHQVPGAVRFRGGEGAWWDARREVVWFTTKGDGRVWTYDDRDASLLIAYDDNTASPRDLTGVDNVTVADGVGDVLVAEDGGNLEVCILVAGGAAPFLRLDGVSGSELTGPAFSPDGRRFYVSSQRNPGRTYEVTGPFRGTATKLVPAPRLRPTRELAELLRPPAGIHLPRHLGPG